MDIKLKDLLLEEYISEGLISSAPLHSVQYHISRWISKLDVFAGVDVANGKLSVSMNDNINDKTLDMLMTLSNNLGYYASAVIYGSSGRISKFSNQIALKSSGEFKIVLERKYDESTHPKSDLYHVTQQKNVPKILKVGLTPKTKSKLTHHPDRIYLADSIFGAKQIKLHFEVLYPNTTFNILKVSIDSVSELDKKKFMIDPKFDHGMYTYHNIPPSALTFVV